MTTKLPLTSIILGDRFRKDLGDIDELKESLEQHGLLQPIGVHRRGEDEDAYILVWGGRRLAAATQLGWHEIEVKVLQNEEDFDLREKELEENLRRKDMTWQEQVESMCEIHKLKVMKNALVGEKWGYRDTGRLLGISLGNVQYTLEVGKYLRQGDDELRKAPNMTEAIRILLRRKEAELLEKKLSTAPKKEDNSFFSQESIAKIEQAGAQQELPLSTDRVFHLHQVDKPTDAAQLIITRTPSDHTGWLLDHPGRWMLFPVSLWDSASIAAVELTTLCLGLAPIINIAHKDSGAPVTEGPFKHALHYYGLIHSGDCPAVKVKDQDPLHVGNSFVDKGIFGPTAVDVKFWQFVFSKLFGRSVVVFIDFPISADSIYGALLAGHIVYSNKAEEHQEFLEGRLKLYGKLEYHP
jgi:ParB family chromosome partitioning protein